MSKKPIDARDQIFAGEGPGTSALSFAGVAEFNGDFHPRGGRAQSTAATTVFWMASRAFPSRIVTWACLAACLLIAPVLGYWSAKTASEVIPPQQSTASQHRQFAAIETVRVGQRVMTLAESGESAPSFETSVDPATWRHLRLVAVDVWPDGTRDLIEVETLQSPEWVAANRAKPGAEVPLPLDLEEMGLPQELKARIVADEPCPAIPEGTGRVVLTTVSHLNPDVWQLEIVDAAGKAQTIRPTGLHKFYSVSRAHWVSAKELRVGEKLRGLSGRAEVRNLARVPGVHRVYNMTVEGEHVYRVSSAGVLVHNNGCKQGPGAGNKALDQLDDISKVQKRLRDGSDKSGKRIVDSIGDSEQRLRNKLNEPYDPDDWL
jgi:hypothetical protein